MAKDTWSASVYNNTAAFVYSQEFTSPVLSLLDAQPGEKILDIGCGSGEVTLRIQQLIGPTGTVVGLDSSQSMVEKSRANGLDRVFVADAQDLRFPPSWPAELQDGYDAVFSNATLHWCKRSPQGVLEAVKRILKPGGRFVVEMGGQMNCVGVRSALYHVLRTRGHDPILLDPWYFPSVDDYKSLLESSGFDVQTISLHPRITPLNGPLIDWLRLFARPYFLKEMTDEEAEEVMAAVQDLCSVDCRDSQGHWSMMYTRLRLVATVPA
ncbi:S-adenosyl-L-methionine-dependent methyltransferase [Wolfiporia cocos MD-104 SS10]|uniref:S-adenosyl-L-methionine-dependent methyltransferase n=1 Tax=Wolfiporia cocos (strain MD-104) TaxID=742152 RepID=A0A2H3JAR8_WOLCO|nr:S-adenosyl-L-methionine-dependent methyltransferase [Wolfiporia cocos MD-104 SS10]